MKLTKAIQRAAIFAAPDKAEDGRGLSGIRLVPAVYPAVGEPAHTVALPTLDDLPKIPVSHIKRRILDAVEHAGSHGVTPSELGVTSGVPLHQASVKLGEMEQTGYIQKAGTDRLAASGGLETVYVSLTYTIHQLRMLPKSPAYVMAHNGRCGVVILLDPEESVPDVLVNARALKATITLLKKTPFQLTPTGPQTTRLRASTGQEFHIAGFDPAGFPLPPVMPSVLRSVLGFDVVRQVVHAAKEDEDRPELSTLHFTPSFVEATDQVRAARVNYTGLVAQPYLISSELFQKWPRSSKLGTGFAVERGNAYVHVDGELRYAAAQDAAKYFDLTPFFTGADQGSHLRVPSALLKQCVKFATSASTRDYVRLVFHPGLNQVTVLGLGDGEEPLFTDVVAAEFLTYTDKKANTAVVVKGRSFWSALDAIGEEVVDIHYTCSERPIQLRTPRYTESLWPLIKVEVPNEAGQS